MTLSAQAHHDGSARLLSDDRDPGDPVRVGVPAEVGATAVHVRSAAGKPSFHSAEISGVEDLGPAGTGATSWDGEVALTGADGSYRFLVETPAGPCWVNGAGPWRRDVADRDDFRVTPFDPPPAWLADTVGFEISGWSDRSEQLMHCRSAFEGASEAGTVQEHPLEDEKQGDRDDR